MCLGRLLARPPEPLAKGGRAAGDTPSPRLRLLLISPHLQLTYSFNPQRVLRDLKKPSTPSVDVFEQTVARHPEDSKSAEAFTSLQDLIIKQDAHALEDAKNRSLERRLEKLTRVAQMSTVRNMLQQERIHF